MLYLYDNAIADDLRKSFNPDNVENPVVTFVNADQAIGVAAQIQNDNISFPLVSLIRKPGSVQLDRSRMNFSRSHFGIASVMDQKTNNLYYEKSLPITLEYALTVLTTNTADRDEMIRELLFKYVNMYFLTIQLPYECSRKVRFGVSISEADIDYSSGSSEYAESGSLYQAIIPLRCDGCVYVTYTPAHLVRTIQDIESAFAHQVNGEGINLI